MKYYSCQALPLGLKSRPAEFGTLIPRRFALGFGHGLVGQDACQN
jgi:hypothetical protein